MIVGEKFLVDKLHVKMIESFHGAGYMKSMFYIYQIVNLTNGKMYIGKTNNPRKRWQRHLLYANDNSHKKSHAIHKSIHKYGSHSFEFRIIQQLSTQEECNLAEIYWIEYYKTCMKKYGKEFGYNITPGGESSGGSGELSSRFGAKHTKESKELMSIATMKQIQEKGHPHLGIKHSQESRTLMSAKAQARSKITKEQAIQTKKLLVEGRSPADISIILNIPKSTVWNIKLGISWKTV
jgi:group I intron endonuclease